MALTKAQKVQQINLGVDKLKGSANLVFVDFNKVSVEDIKRLRKELKKQGADFKVLKKRILKIAFQKSGVDFDPLQFKAQLGTIFLPKDLSDFAAQIYKFSKELERAKKGEFKVLGSFDLSEKRFIDVNEFNTIAKLPSREVLLAQVVMMLTMPMKQLMQVLNERSKQIN
jgi:large subunit ribosomal protein L10